MTDTEPTDHGPRGTRRETDRDRRRSESSRYRRRLRRHHRVRAGRRWRGAGKDRRRPRRGSAGHRAVRGRERSRVCSQPGFDVRWRDVLATATAAREAVADGADGVVVTHGTDTLADTVRARPAHRPSRTGGRHGAQRRLDEPSSDVPANLTLAVRAAADDRFAPGSTSRSTTRSTPPATWSRATATRSRR